jgi:hypothetical protein
MLGLANFDEAVFHVMNIIIPSWVFLFQPLPSMEIPSFCRSCYFIWFLYMVVSESVGTPKVAKEGVAWAKITCIFVYKVGVYDTSYVPRYLFVTHLGCKT